MEAFEVTVEVHLSGGLPSFTLSGLPAAAVRESRDRVRAALQTLGMPVPPRRITAHLGPADIPKEGGRFDLAISLGLLKADRNPDWKTDEIEFLGELALNGELRPVQGALPGRARGPGRRAGSRRSASQRGRSLTGRGCRCLFRSRSCGCHRASRRARAVVTRQSIRSHVRRQTAGPILPTSAGSASQNER